MKTPNPKYMHVVCLWQKYYFRVQDLCVLTSQRFALAKENVYFVKSLKKKGQR